MKTAVVFLPILTLLFLWQIAVQISPQSKFLLSSPAEILWCSAQLVLRRSTWCDFGFTASAALVGLLLGSLLGTLLGIALVLFPRARHAARWYLLLFGAVPPLALAPMVILWCGVGWSAKVCLAGLATTLLSLQLSSASAQVIFEQYGDYLAALNAPRWRVVLHLLTPGALLWIVESYRASISLAILGVFVGEYMNSSHGVGHMILRAVGIYRIDEVWFGVILLAALALALYALGNLALRLCAPGHARKMRC